LLDPVAKTEGTPAPQVMLLAIKGVGPEFAAVLWSEGLFRLSGYILLGSVSLSVQVVFQKR
jgi:hypothetical protein